VGSIRGGVARREGLAACLRNGRGRFESLQGGTGGGCMRWNPRVMGGAGGHKKILCHPPGAQLGPPCYQYEDQGSTTREDVVSGMKRRV
jgi:hypothetical protein